MATTSEVKVSLDRIAGIIKNCRQSFEQAKTRIQKNYDDLDDIPTTFSDVIDTIDGYGTTDPFEALCKAEKDKLTAEFVALKAEINALIAEF